MKPLELMEQGRFLGEEFLLWLWMHSMTEGGASGEDGDGSGCFVDDAIQLVSERGEVKEISLRKGNPSESREAFEALSRGMRPAKVKLRLLSGDLEWVFTLNAATLDMGTLKLPPSTGKAPHERLHDRLFLLEEGTAHLERRLKRFLHARSQDSEGLQEAMRAWVRAGRTGEAMPAGGGSLGRPEPSASSGGTCRASGPGSSTRAGPHPHARGPSHPPAAPVPERAQHGREGPSAGFPDQGRGSQWLGAL